MSRQHTGEASAAGGKRFHSFRASVSGSESELFFAPKIRGISAVSIVNQGDKECVLEARAGVGPITFTSHGRLKPGQVWKGIYDPNPVARIERIWAKCDTGDTTTLDIFLTGEARIA